MSDKKKAVLVVSFGTSYEETRKKTIDRIENDMAEAFPSYAVYRAWTSGMIRAKLLKRDGIRIYNVCEALEAMAADGIREVVVQPTHVINGIENDQMKADVAALRSEVSTEYSGESKEERHCRLPAGTSRCNGQLPNRKSLIWAAVLR